MQRRLKEAMGKEATGRDALFEHLIFLVALFYKYGYLPTRESC
jgi:hypothetical protein